MALDEDINLSLCTVTALDRGPTDMHALEAAGHPKNSFIHMRGIVTALSSTEPFLYYVARQPISPLPISAHGCHLPAIFSAAPVLCELPRPSAPPALALDWPRSLGARLQLEDYRQHLANHQVAHVPTSAAWNVVGPAWGVLVKTATSRRNWTRTSVALASLAVDHACLAAFVLDAVAHELCSVFPQRAKRRGGSLRDVKLECRQTGFRRDLRRTFGHLCLQLDRGRLLLRQIV